MKKLTGLILSCLCLFCFLMPSKFSYVYAANDDMQFDKSNVLDDLRSSSINGTAFNINNYPYNENGKVQIINFVEYCYSFKANMQSNYGLYVYVYNPAGLNFNTATISNKIQLAMKYNAEEQPKDYEKISLQFCSMSTDSSYYRLFYKFKVRFSDEQRTSLLNRLNSNERRYDVSGIELFTVGANNAIEYELGLTYRFSGYAQGYGANTSAASNLTVDIKELETISLDVKHTYHRTGIYKKDYQYQIDSVYFAVDDSFLQRYGQLQKVKAEWYEYKTKEIVVTTQNDFYNKLKSYIGQTISTTKHNDDISYSMFYNYQTNLSTIEAGIEGNIDWGYNYDRYIKGDYWADSLYYLFKVDDIEEYVDSKVLYEYIMTYDKSFKNGTLPIKERNISADLFLDTIDADRAATGINRGYNCLDIDAGDTLDLLSYKNGNASFWDKLKDFGLGAALWSSKLPELSSEYSEVPPIYEVTDNDIKNSDIAKKLLINENDITAFKQYYNKMKEEGKKVFIFRYAVTDYFSGKIELLERGFLGVGWRETGKCYIAQETIFLDFDVIQLTFNREGNYYVIPVVSSPIDIVNGITAPLESDNDSWAWLKNLLSIILLVFLLMFLSRWLPVLTWLFDKVLLLLKLPFIIIKSIFKGGG